MKHEIPESDWKTFSQLRLVALERFCKRVLDEVRRFPSDTELRRPAPLANALAARCNLRIRASRA
jgi:hypothetical protein